MGPCQLYSRKSGLGLLLYPGNHRLQHLLGLLPQFSPIYTQTESVLFWHICGIQPHELDTAGVHVVEIYHILCKLASEMSLLEELAFLVCPLPDVVCVGPW